MAAPPANGVVPPGFDASNPRRDILGDLPDQAIEKMTVPQLKLWIERAGGVRHLKQRPRKKDVVDTLKNLRDLAKRDRNPAAYDGGASQNSYNQNQQNNSGPNSTAAWFARYQGNNNTQSMNNANAMPSNAGPAGAGGQSGAF